MPLDLYVGPPRKRPWRWFVVAVLGLLLAGWFAGRQGWLPDSILAAWPGEGGPNSRLSFPVSLFQQPAEDEAGVIEDPRNPAYTAELYQPDAGQGQVPWPNIGGRTRVLTYTVQPGDTLWSIAAEFELDLDTLRWSNPSLEQNPDLVVIGAELLILPITGVYHRVSGDETLETIAQLYGVTPQAIAEYPPNGLYPPYKLKFGQGLIIPYGRKGEALPPALAETTQLTWPVISGATGDVDLDSPGLNITAPAGATVYAAESGQLSAALVSEDGQGYTVSIDHGGGLETRYINLTTVLLPAGSYVNRGDPLGEVGSIATGTGAEMRFEIRYNDRPVDPRDYLAAPEPQE